MSEQQFRRSVSRGTDIGDFLVSRLRCFIPIHPCYAKVADIGGAGGGSEEDVRGLNVAVNDVERVNVREPGEDVAEVGSSLFRGGRGASRAVEKSIEIQGKEWEHKSEFAACEWKGVEEREDVGVKSFLEDASFAERVVRSSALGGHCEL